MLLDCMEIVLDDFLERLQSNITKILGQAAVAFLGSEEFTEDVDSKGSQGSGRFYTQDGSNALIENSISGVFIGRGVGGNLLKIQHKKNENNYLGKNVIDFFTQRFIAFSKSSEEFQNFNLL